MGYHWLDGTPKKKKKIRLKALTGDLPMGTTLFLEGIANHQEQFFFKKKTTASSLNSEESQSSQVPSYYLETPQGASSPVFS